MQQSLFLPWSARTRHSAPPQRQWRLFALRRERITDDDEAARTPSAEVAGDGAAQDAETFESFYHSQERGIFTYLWRVCGDEQTANDLTQEVFFRAWRQFDKLRGYERPEAWLFRVATNLALNERRHQRVAGPAATLRGHERASSDHASQFAERSALSSALDGLAPQQRAAFILRELYGHSLAEIATILGVSVAAAKMSLSRARERLRRLYLKEDAE
ncbi:MAG TPA: RNA polymerase sigma factor [Ktedonobacterales bacterium]|nr:RNA polymerase sigma factor [Ktedonobacterales bacterium]